MIALDRIEAILAEIEQLDAATNGQFRQADDREALDIVSRIERKLRGRTNSENKSETTSDTASGASLI